MTTSTLGPYHIGIVRGIARHASFESAVEHMHSGGDYDFIDYGLKVLYKVPGGVRQIIPLDKLFHHN